MTLAVTRLVGPSLLKPAQPHPGRNPSLSASPTLKCQSCNAEFAVFICTLPTHHSISKEDSFILFLLHTTIWHNNQQQPPSRTTWICHPSLFISNTHSQRPRWYALACLSAHRLYPHGPLGSCRQQISPKNSSVRSASVDKPAAETN